MAKLTIGATAVALLLSGCSGGGSADIHDTPEAKAQAAKAEAGKQQETAPNAADMRRQRDGGDTTGGRR